MLDCYATNRLIMAKVIQRPLKPRKGSPSKEKITVRNNELRLFYPKNSVSANSSTFTSDMGEAFRINVETALKKKK